MPKSTSAYNMTKLPSGFSPSCRDVICARGKDVLEHPGNVAFRKLVEQNKQAYASASNCKDAKSKVVTRIINTVRRASPDGGFVKKIDGVWYAVSDRHAREKVGQTFRDLLFKKYSSSTKAKARVRVQRRLNTYTGTSSCQISEEKKAKSTTSVVSNDSHLDRPCNLNVTSGIKRSSSVISFHGKDRSDSSLSLNESFSNFYESFSSLDESVSPLNEEFSSLESISPLTESLERSSSFAELLKEICRIGETTCNLESDQTQIEDERGVFIASNLDPLPMEESLVEEYFSKSSLL
jgi:hypothetical protein